MIRDEEALEYHERGRKGKLEVVPSKPCITQRDLSLAYTPGVAVPCRRIEADPDEAYRYTGKGNLVGVVSNGTAVLGLGDIGALAGKPVMEGKGVLFKRFADIDVFDIEVDSHDPEEIIRTVKLLEPTFGGINLEDIKAPECFEVEERLKAELDIPVFHDDQHGTAIISGAALLNALEVVGKPIGEARVVFNGAGASGIACATYYISLGVSPENLILCDSKGVIYQGRTAGMNPYKERLAADTDARTLADAMVGADVFVGLSTKDVVTRDMVRSMAENPIVFAMANPDPEITYDEAKAARPDVIMATGRSDYPNQVNNVLGFPFIFRGALDVRATAINEEMKRAATRALADLAKEDVPDAVMKAYGLERLQFGREYLIPKPFDDRVLIWEAAAVAQAAMDTGVARRPIDIEQYKVDLERRLGKARHTMRTVMNWAKRAPKRVVFPEGTTEKVLRAARVIVDEGFARPILLGERDQIMRRSADLGIDLAGVTIVEPGHPDEVERYARELFRLRQRKGMTRADARGGGERAATWGALMVHLGDADALVHGVGKHFPEAIRPALKVIGKRPGRLPGGEPLHADGPRPGLLLRRSDGQHRPDRGRARRHRHHGCRGRPPVQPGAARGHAVVLELRQRRPPVRAQGPGGDADRPRALPGPDGRRRDAGGHRRGRGADRRAVPVQHSRGRRQRARLPRSPERQRRLQAGPAPGRRRGGRPDPHGHEEAGPRHAAGL